MLLLIPIADTLPALEDRAIEPESTPASPPSESVEVVASPGPVTVEVAYEPDTVRHFCRPGPVQRRRPTDLCSPRLTRRNQRFPHRK